MIKFLKRLMAVLVGILVGIFMGCMEITPTIVPPMTKELGYEVPNFKGLTVYGLVKGSYALEEKKMILWGYSVQSTLATTEKARSGVLDILTIVGLGGTAALPAALKKVPTGYKKESDNAG